MDYQKNNILENQGWVEIEFSSETINFLDNLISLNHSLDLEIKNKFSKEDSFQNEVAQAAKTSILRYSNQSKIFVKSMVKDLKFKNQDLNNLDVKKNIRWLET